MQCVRRLLREKSTGLFLSPDGGWTNEFEQARSFEDVGALITVAVRMRDRAFEEVLVLGETPSKFDLVMPISFYPRGEK